MTLRSTRLLAAVCAVIMLLFSQQLAPAAGIVGIGAMGASETQGTDFDGSWVPWLAVDRGLNFGPGQDYNVAIGGSKSADLLAQGQHTDIASLVSSGDVNLAFLTVGGLDFPPKAQQILTHTLNVPAFVNQITGNIGTAMTAVLGAGPARMIVLSVPDMSLTGGGQRLLTSPALRQPTVDVVDAVNLQLKSDVLGRGQVYVDFASAMRIWTNQPLIIGGVTINTHVENATNPTYLWRDDLHVGAVGNGIFANLMLSAINKAYGLNIPIFSDAEILAHAGLSSQYVGHQTSNIDYQSFTVVPTPEPSTFMLAILAAGTIALANRRRRTNWCARPA